MYDTQTNLTNLDKKHICKIKIDHIDNGHLVDKCVCSAIVNIIKSIIIIKNTYFSLDCYSLLLQTLFCYNHESIDIIGDKIKIYQTNPEKLELKKDDPIIFEQIFLEYPKIYKLINPKQSKIILKVLNDIYFLINSICNRNNSPDSNYLKNRINYFASINYSKSKPIIPVTSQSSDKTSQQQTTKPVQFSKEHQQLLAQMMLENPNIIRGSNFKPPPIRNTSTISAPANHRKIFEEMERESSTNVIDNELPEWMNAPNLSAGRDFSQFMNQDDMIFNDTSIGSDYLDTNDNASVDSNDSNGY